MVKNHFASLKECETLCTNHCQYVEHTNFVIIMLQLCYKNYFPSKLNPFYRTNTMLDAKTTITNAVKKNHLTQD